MAYTGDGRRLEIVGKLTGKYKLADSGNLGAAMAAGPGG
jgi:hypothetical protein